MATPRAISIERTRRASDGAAAAVVGEYCVALNLSCAVTVCTAEKFARSCRRRQHPAANGARCAASGAHVREMRNRDCVAPSPRIAWGVQQSPRIQPWMLVSAAWLAPAFLGFVTAVGEAHIFGQPLELAGAIFYGADWLLYAVLTPGVFFFARRWPIARPHLVSRTLIHVALSLVFSALWAGGGTLLKLVLQPNSFRHGVAQFAVSWFVGTLPFGCAV